jgi:hypothetical protein
MNVYLNDREVFVDGDQAPAFTLSLADLLDPSSIRGIRTGTIRVLNTPESRGVLGSEALYSSTGKSFTIAFKQEGFTVFSAEARLMQADRNVYELAAIGGNALWFDWAKKTKLNELDLGYTAEVTATVIADSWQANAPLAYFPLIDHGSFEDRAADFAVFADLLRPGVGLRRAMAKGFLDIGWTLKPMGLFGDEFFKMVIYNGARDAKSLDNGNSTTSQAVHYAMDGTVTYEFKRYGSAAPLPVDTTDLNVSLDPSAMFVGDMYQADRDMRMHTILDELEISIPSGYTGLRFRISLWDDTDGRELCGLWTRAMQVADGSAYTFSGELPVAFVLKNHDVFLAVFLDTAFGSTTDLGSLTGGPPTQVQFHPETEYRYDAKLKIASAAPAMAIMDVLKGLNDWRALVFRTIPTERIVEVMYDEAFFRPLTSADKRDLTRRIDHTIAPVKMLPSLPARMHLRFKDDKNDREVLRITRLIGEPGYANATMEIGGALDEKTTTLPFAATAMGTILNDNLFVPIIRREGGNYQQAYFDIEPRILICDGTLQADWKLQADPYLETALSDMTYYPKCYFLWSGSKNVPMAFGDAIHVGAGVLPNTTPGTTKRSLVKRLQRLTHGRTFEALTEWRDDELVDFDHGKPTVVNDGHGDFICYVLKVQDRRLGSDRFTKTQFVEAFPVSDPEVPIAAPEPEGCCEGGVGIIVTGAGFEAINGIYCPDAGAWHLVGGTPGEDSLQLALSPDRHVLLSGGVEIYFSVDGPGGPYFATNEAYEPAPTVTNC